MNYYSRYPAHYVTKTLHLTMEQDGAYTRLLDWCYANERAIPDADKFSIARAMKKSEKNAVLFVLSSFFSLRESGWINARVFDEISKAAPKIEAAKINGLKGGRPKNQKPNGFPENNPMGLESETQWVSKSKAPQSPIEAKSKDQKKKRPSPAATALPEIPDWVDLDAWRGFVEMRTKTRHPLTRRAAELVLSELLKLRNLGHDPTAVLDRSVRNSWRDVFPILEGSNHANRNTSRKLSAVEQVEQAIRERRAREADEPIAQIGHG